MEKENKKRIEGYLRSTISNENRGLLCCLRWRAMEEENKGERYERKGRKISGITGGHFWNISKKLKCFFKKKHLSSDSLKITSSVFPDFQKCFLKFAKHFIFIPKTLKSVFKGRNTFKNHCQTGS